MVHVLILLDIKKQIKSLFPRARNWLGVIFRCVMIIQFVLNALLIAVLYETTVKLSYTTSLITITYLRQLSIWDCKLKHTFGAFYKMDFE